MIDKIKKKVEVVKELLTFKQIDEGIDKPKTHTKLTAKGHRKGCNCRK